MLVDLPGAIEMFVDIIEQRHEIDYTIVDLNPGLGAFNQNFIISADGFVIPANPDPFSLIAIKTLGD